MEQCLLLIAAWQMPQYKQIALDFTMDDKAVTVETLVRELERQRLLTSHLNLSQGLSAPLRPNRQVDVRVTSTPTRDAGLCYAFQKGKCSRQDCPFLHEKGATKPAVMAGRPVTKPGPIIKPPRNSKPIKKFQQKSDRTCYRCGSDKHLAPECTFKGTCDYCKAEGHKQSTCKKKRLDSNSKVSQSIADGIVSVRMSVLELDHWSSDDEKSQLPMAEDDLLRKVYLHDERGSKAAQPTSDDVLDDELNLASKRSPVAANSKRK